MLLPFDQAFVISLRDKRWDRFWRDLPEAMRRITRKLEATDGSLVDMNAWSKEGRLSGPRRPEIINNRHLRVLTRGELGCYSSHERGWQFQVQNSIQRVAYFEDDADLSHPQLLSRLHDIERDLQHPDVANSYDVCYLGRNWEPHTASLSSTGNLTRPQIDGEFHVLHAYILTLEGAKKLLAHSRPYSLPVDVYVASQTGTGMLRPLQTTKSLIGVVEAPSDTQGIR